MNILIIRLSSMGDVVLCTSVFSFLKTSFPNANLWFVTGNEYAELFLQDNRLFKVLSYCKIHPQDLQKDLQAVSFDHIIDLQNSSKSHLLIEGLKTVNPVRSFDKLHTQRFMLLFLRLHLYNTCDTVLARYIKAASITDSNSQISIPDASLCIARDSCCKKAEALSPQTVVRPRLALFPFSAWRNKEWPRNYFAVVGKYFSVKGWNVILFGGPQDKTDAQTLKNHIGEQCISAAGELSLADTACLISQCNLALGNDSGLSHMARACRVKTGFIYGSTTRDFGFFPEGSVPFKVFEKQVICRPCHAHGGNICIRAQRYCLKKIEPEEVIAGLLELYHGNK